MKVLTISFFVLLLFFQGQAQESKRSLPAVDLKTTEGKTFNTKDVMNDGNPVVISFWATWCKPCVTELNSVSDLYAEWKEKTGVKVIAVSIDDARNMAKVAPFVNGKEWEFDVLLDPNGDFKRAMNVNVIPHTFLLNGNNEIVWQHSGYAPGDELKLFEKIKNLKSGKDPVQ